MLYNPFAFEYGVTYDLVDYNNNNDNNNNLIFNIENPNFLTKENNKYYKENKLFIVFDQIQILKYNEILDYIKNILSRLFKRDLNHDSFSKITKTSNIISIKLKKNQLNNIEEIKNSTNLNLILDTIFIDNDGFIFILPKLVSYK